MRIAAHATDEAIARGSIHMHAIASVIFERDVFHGELMGVRQMHAERTALADGDVLHRHTAHVL